MLPSATLWKRAVIARLYLLQHRTKPKKRPRNGQVNKPTKNDSRFLLSFICRCVAVLSEEFCAETSHLCSAPPLGCGTSRRFERLVWASLRLSERSRTIEVRITTLSPQICTKSLTQSCLALSAQSILTRLTEYELSGKDPLLACLSLNRAPKKDRATGR